MIDEVRKFCFSEATTDEKKRIKLLIVSSVVGENCRTYQSVHRATAYIAGISSEAKTDSRAVRRGRHQTLAAGLLQGYRTQIDSFQTNKFS